ncbi:MAG: hypothetical protein ACLFNK_02645 [Candidatus Woesearchaeota archaeon]
MNTEHLERPEIYDLEMTIYSSYWRSIEKNEEEYTKRELLDLSELCIEKMKKRFRELFYGLEDLTKKKISLEEAQPVYEKVVKAHHKVEGMAFLVEDIFESIRRRIRYAERCEDNHMCRLERLIEDYNVIRETQKNILEEYAWNQE